MTKEVKEEQFPINEGSYWFKRFAKEVMDTYDDIEFRRIKHGFYRIYWTGSGYPAYVGECYKEMPRLGYEINELDANLVSKKYYEEFRKEDVYNLGVFQKEKDYFFQRVYDEQSIENRILNSLNNYEILCKKIFGEKDSSFYKLYKKRWDEKSYFETVKDPHYISKYFKEFESTDQLPGIGIMGLSIRKKK